MRIHVPDNPSGRLTRRLAGLRRHRPVRTGAAPRLPGLAGPGPARHRLPAHPRPRPAQRRGRHPPAVRVPGHPQVRHAFTYVDQVIDAYLELGIRPFLELGFMPSGLASGDQTVFWWRGNVTPPRLPGPNGRDLVRATLRHLIDRYGLDQVRGWPIEVWNEPNLTASGRTPTRTPTTGCTRSRATAVKEVDAELQVGGPAISPGGDDWLAPFAEFVTARAVPIDFVSQHAYTSGPAQHVPFGTHQTLDPATNLLEQFASPRRHLRGTALPTCPCTSPSSTPRTGRTTRSTTRPSTPRTWPRCSPRGGDLVDSFSYWTFSDVFEEVGMPTALFHGGFGLLTHRQVKKPTYHLYAFMARMGDQILARGEDHLVTRRRRRPGHRPGLGAGRRHRAGPPRGPAHPAPVASRWEAARGTRPSCCAPR